MSPYQLLDAKSKVKAVELEELDELEASDELEVSAEFEESDELETSPELEESDELKTAAELEDAGVELTELLGVEVIWPPPADELDRLLDSTDESEEAFDIFAELLDVEELVRLLELDSTILLILELDSAALLTLDVSKLELEEDC